MKDERGEGRRAGGGGEEEKSEVELGKLEEEEEKNDDGVDYNGNSIDDYDDGSSNDNGSQ